MSEFAQVPQEALAALDSAMAADGMSGEPTGVVSPPGDGFDPANEGLPSGTTQNQDAATPAQEATAPVAPETPSLPEDSFTERFDPSTLPPELLPAYKSMQADYTRKRQADVEAIRLAQQYQGIDLDSAVELFQQIQDPNGLLTFVQQAGEYLAQNGLAEWDTPGTQAPTGDGENNLTQALDALATGDPELAPLAEAVKAMQQRLDSFEQTAEQRMAAEREETAMLQALGEVQRQENIIRTDNPQYDQSDIDAIYELASHHDGNLLTAQQSYEAHFARRLGRYVGQKETVADPVVPSGLPTPAAAAELNYDPLNPKEAHAAAMETLRLIESQG